MRTKKLKLLSVFLLAGFMVSAVSTASAVTKWAWDYGEVGHWDDAHDGQNWRDSATGAFVSEPNGTQDVDYPVDVRGPSAVCTVDTVVDWPKNTTDDTRLHIYDGATLNVVNGADVRGFGWVRIGIKGFGAETDRGFLNQTGGRVMLTVQGDAGAVTVGDGRASDYGRMQPGSTYTISGGTLTYDAEDSNCLGHLAIGGRNGYGQMTIVGTAPVINMNNLYIAGDTTGTGVPYSYGTGILEYQIGSDGVSPIALDGTAYIDLGDADGDGQHLGETTIARLVFQLTAAPPAGQDILLIDANSAIQGTFDAVTGDINGGKGEEGDRIVLTYGEVEYRYTLTYAGGDDGCDMVLLIPEPATVALLGLGLIAIRRR